MTPKILWKYLQRFIILLTGRLGGAIAAFSANILIARNLGVEALGMYAVFVSLVSILTICLPIGFNSVATFFTAEYTAKDKPALLKGYILVAIKYLFITASFLFITLLIARYFTPHLLDYNNFLFAIIVLATAVATSLLNLNSVIMIGLKRQVAGLLPETLVRPILILLVVLSLMAFNTLSNVYNVMVVSALVSWVAVALAFFGNAKIKFDFLKTKPENELPRWKKASYPWLATSLLWDNAIDLILLIVTMLSGTVEIAILHICFRYRVLAGFGMRTIYTLLMPEITGHMVTKDMAAVNKKITLANLASLVYSIVALAIFAVIGSWLLGLFSEKISDVGVPILIIVSLTMLIRAIFGPATLLLAIHNLHIATAVISLIGFLFAIAVILLFFEEYGLLTVAIAYSLSNLVVSVSLWLYAKKKTGIDSSIFAAIRTSKTKQM